MRTAAPDIVLRDLARLRRVEFEYGVAKHNDILTKVGRMLVELRGDRVRSNDLLCRADDGDAFVYFLSASRRTGDHPPEELEGVSQRVQEAIDNALAREVFDLIHDHPRIAGDRTGMKGPEAARGPGQIEAFEIIDTVGFHVSRAVQGQATPEEAMADANTAIEELLRDAGYSVGE